MGEYYLYPFFWLQGHDAPLSFFFTKIATRGKRGAQCFRVFFFTTLAITIGRGGTQCPPCMFFFVALATTRGKGAHNAPPYILFCNNGDDRTKRGLNVPPMFFFAVMVTLQGRGEVR
jgi:hypothetical protein